MALSASAVPNHPGESVALRLLVASRTMAGFHRLGGLATLKLRNEAESGSLAPAADAFASAGFDGQVTPAAAASATR